MIKFFGKEKETLELETLKKVSEGSWEASAVCRERS